MTGVTFLGIENFSGGVVRAKVISNIYDNGHIEDTEITMTLPNGTHTIPFQFVAKPSQSEYYNFNIVIDLGGAKADNIIVYCGSLMGVINGI